MEKIAKGVINFVLTKTTVGDTAKSVINEVVSAVTKK
jgi:hypothetical protein